MRKKFCAAIKRLAALMRRLVMPGCLAVLVAACANEEPGSTRLQLEPESVAADSGWRASTEDWNRVEITLPKDWDLADSCGDAPTTGERTRATITNWAVATAPTAAVATPVEDIGFYAFLEALANDGPEWEARRQSFYQDLWDQQIQDQLNEED